LRKKRRSFIFIKNACFLLKKLHKSISHARIIKSSRDERRQHIPFLFLLKKNNALLKRDDENEDDATTKTTTGSSGDVYE